MEVKVKQHTFGTISNGGTDYTDLLVGLASIKRRIIGISADIDAGIRMQIYRNQELVVDCPCDIITTAAPIMPCDIPLGNGDVASVGFYNISAGDVTPQVVIQYSEG